MVRNSDSKIYAVLGLTAGVSLGIGYIFKDYSSRLQSEGKFAEKSATLIAVPAVDLSLSNLTYFDVLYSPPERYAIDSSENYDVAKWGHLVDKPNHSRLSAALNHVLGSETPEAAKESTSVPLSTGSAYAVQVGSFDSFEAAERWVKVLLAKGYNVQVVQGEISGQLTVFRVRIHGFNDLAAAESAKDIFEQKENRKALVIAQS